MNAKLLHLTFPKYLCFSHSGKTIASIDEKSRMCLWNFPEIKLIYQDCSERSHLESNTVLCFSTDDALIATGRDDGRVEIWDTNTFLNIRTILVHADYIRKVLFSPNDKFLFVNSYDRSVHVLDTKTWEIKFTTIIGLRFERITSVSFALNSEQLIIGSDDGLLYVFDILLGVKTLQKRIFCERITELTCLSNNTILCVGSPVRYCSREKKVVVFDIQCQSIKELLSIDTRHACFLNSNLLIVTDTNRNNNSIWQIDNFKCLRKVPDTFSDCFICAVDHQNNIICVGTSETGIFKLIDYKTVATVGKILLKLSLATYVTLDVINFITANTHTSFETEQQYKSLKKISLLANLRQYE